MVERLYHIVPWLDRRMHFTKGGKMFLNDIGAIIAIEKSVRRLVHQNAVDVIRRLPNAWKWVLHVGGDYF